LICSSPSNIPSNGEDEDKTTGTAPTPHIMYYMYFTGNQTSSVLS